MFLSILFATGFSHFAFAEAPVITGISGASAYSLTGTVSATGGTAGSCTGSDNITPCNSCSTSLTACNTARIYDGLVLRISASHADTGNLIAIETENSVVLSTAPHNSDNVGLTWGSICRLVFGSATDCDGTLTSKEATIRICVDKDTSNTFTTGDECQDLRIKVVQVTAATFDVYGAPTSEGVSDFVPYPGDEKIYIEGPNEGPIETTDGFPTMTYGGTITGLRVYIGENNMTEATPGSGLDPVDLALIENGSTLDDSIVDGLENNRPYWFRIGLIDDANNVVQFFPPSATESCDTGLPCSYAATPDQVLGLLTEDINCFIATAAYGTSFNDKLDTFREFRFKRLLPYEWGRRFIESYYKYGPFAARFIHDKPLLRTATRGLLWPAYGFSLLSLRLGLWPALFITLFALTLMVALPLYGVRRFFRRA